MLAGKDVRGELSLDATGLAAVLFGVPLVLGLLLESALLALTRHVDRRGLLVVSLLAMATTQGIVAWAPSVAAFSLAFAVWAAASGLSTTLAEVGLISASADPERAMTRWGLAGSIGDLLAPLLFAAAASAGLGWRAGIAAGGALAVANALAVALGPPLVESGEADDEKTPLSEILSEPWLWVWVATATACTLFDEIFVAFGGLRLREIGATPVTQGLAFALFSMGMATGQITVDRALSRWSAAQLLLAASALCLVIWPLWLVVSPAGAIAVSFVLGFAVAPMWSLCTAQAYATGKRAAVVATLANGFGLFDAILPLGLGLVADRWGLATALALLAFQPLLVGTLALIQVRRSFIRNTAGDTA